jgi:uncharacterized LabA/DUF88 family protein
MKETTTKRPRKKKEPIMGLGPMVVPILEDHTRRWMLFVDGENFTIRAQELAKLHKFTLKKGRYYEPNVFVWLPNIAGRQSIVPNAPVGIQPVATRAYYYTSAVGDESKLTQIKESLWGLGFHPEVFKKERQSTRTKGVDIALAKDFLSNAFLNNYDAAVLLAGDADYVPMVNEVKRLGKLVYVIFFHESGLGLSRNLQVASDVFFKIDDSFMQEWGTYLSSDSESMK